jgi:hypothetical protein
MKLIARLTAAAFIFGSTAAMAADECADRAAALSTLGAAPVHRTDRDYFLRLRPFTRMAVSCWPWGAQFAWRADDDWAVSLVARTSSMVLRTTESTAQVAATSCLSRAEANADRQGSVDFFGLHVECHSDRIARFVRISY